MISFVFYFSARRLKNLEQTLRFLNNNENLKNKEVILVCNDNIVYDFKIPNYKLFNLNIDTYIKPFLCNYGVNKAKYDIVALLDSDRILPYRYFEKKASSLQKKQFLSSLILHKLLNDYSDQEIELKKYKYKEEFKSKTCRLHSKNLFSGNTLFYKKDYIDSGGMDESFEGYGYADNDMTYNVISKGYSAIWNKEIEIHLNHSTDFLYKGKILYDFYPSVVISNLNKLKNKWPKNFWSNSRFKL